MNTQESSSVVKKLLGEDDNAKGNLSISIKIDGTEVDVINDELPTGLNSHDRFLLLQNIGAMIRTALSGSKTIPST